MALELYQPLLLDVDRHLTFHGVENPFFKRRRLESQVGCEVECHEIALSRGIAERIYFRQHPEQTRTLLCLLVACPLQFTLLVRMADKLLYALVLFSPLSSVKRVAINGEKLAERTIVC